MNCVYDAYRYHLDDLKMSLHYMDWSNYERLKHFTHGHQDQPTYGGIVPCLIGWMRLIHDLEMRIQHGLLTKAHHLEETQTLRQRLIIQNTDFGVYAFPLTLEPAIYLLYADSHAVYSRTVPTYGVPIMAIQLRRPE